MSGERLTKAQLRDILASEHGVVFFPKRPLVIPEINPEIVKAKIIHAKFKYAYPNLAMLILFLKGEAVGDQWGSDHTQRRKWRSKLAQQYGEDFLTIYFTNNQLRGHNMLGLTRVAVLNLGRYTNEPTLKEKLAQKAAKLTQAIQGYGRIDGLEEKLSIVHLYEDTAIETLNEFS